MTDQARLALMLASYNLEVSLTGANIWPMVKWRGASPSALRDPSNEDYAFS
jgi:hypothetical protein